VASEALVVSALVYRVDGLLNHWGDRLFCSVDVGESFILSALLGLDDFFYHSVSQNDAGLFAGAV